MEQILPIIETKLIPPMVKKSVIRRAPLMKKMRTISQYPLTVIHSGAGYGKSTALSLFLHDYKLNGAWYTITSNDDDLLPFITYIIYSLRKRYQNFGVEVLNFIKTIHRYIRDTEINILNALFIKEISQLPEETILVLDDFHLVDHSFSINQWLEKLVEHLPGHFHLIISSRTRPKWKLLTKWKVSGGLLEIDETEMALSLEEIQTLFEDFYTIQIQAHELNKIYHLTEGWVIAVSLIAEQLKKGISVQSILDYHHSSMEDLFHYLAMEVFSKQSPIVQNFIEQVSVLEEITPAICNEILGIEGSEVLLEQLVERNAFMSKLSSSQQYRFHALFKAAIERKFREEQNHLFRQINEKVAQYYENRFSWELAITHYEKVQNDRAIAYLLEKAAQELLISGKQENLADHLRNLPADTKDHHLSLWYYEGEVQRYLAYYDKAKNCYLHLIELAGQDNNKELMGKAYEGLAKIYLDTIQPGVAERYLHLAIETMEESLGKTHPDTQKLYGLMAENLINSGQAKKAEKWIIKMSTSQSSMSRNNLDARLYLRTGKLEKAKEILTLRLEEQDRTLPQTHRETEILLSYIEASLGNGLEAKQYAQKGIEQGVKYKNLFVEACGWMRLAHAGQLLNDYSPTLTEQCYLTALDLMEKVHISRGKAEPYMGLCLLYSKRGEFERSKQIGQMALYETENVQDVWLSSYIRLSMGIAAFNCEQYEDAKNYFSEAFGYFERCDDPYGLMLCHLWVSFYYHLLEDWETFSEAISRFLQEVQIGNYEFIFSKSTPFGPKDLLAFIPILLKAKDLNVFKPYVHSILQNLGLDDIDSHPGYTLKVGTFGEFQVLLGDQLITDKDWQRMKAKELFQFLLIKRDRWWTKEEIYEQLWPEVPEKNIEQEFKVILNACHKALEPKRKARSSPFYIVRQNNSYRISPRAVLDLDFEQLDHWVQLGLREKQPDKAIPYLLKGLELYQGEFMPGKWDHLSIEGERSRFRTLFLRGSEKLAQTLVQTNQINDAIFWCEKILSIDNTWEEAYRLLMFCHYQKNNRPLALKYYKKCCDILEEEFGVEPMETTKQMYEIVLEG